MTLSTLLNGVPRRAAHVIRYSSRAVINHENVAEHTFHTMFYSWVIATDMKQKHYYDAHNNLDLSILMTRALLHDLEECSLGDVIRDLKHADPDITRLLDLQGLKAVQRMEEELGLGPESVSLPWAQSKCDDLEGQIVRVADCMSVVSYLVEEHLLGNRTLTDIHDNVVRYLKEVHVLVLHAHLKDLVWEVLEYFVDAVSWRVA